MTEPDKTTGQPPSEPPKSVFVRNKRLTLWLSVAASMAFVAIMWVMVLPLQLQNGGLPGAADVSRWRVQPAAKEAGGSFMQQIDRMGEELKRRFSDTAANASPIQAAAAVVNADSLTAKLEAAVNAMPAGSDLINAANLTQKLEAATNAPAAPENPDEDAKEKK